MNKRHVYPGFDVEDREGLVELRARDLVAIPYEARRHGTLWHLCRINSVVSYALHNGDCPIEAVHDAERRGEPMWWLNKLPATIDRLGRPKATYIGLREGQRIRFEGRTFEIRGTSIVTVDTSRVSA